MAQSVLFKCINLRYETMASIPHVADNMSNREPFGELFSLPQWRK